VLISAAVVPIRGWSEPEFGGHVVDIAPRKLFEQVRNICCCRRLIMTVLALCTVQYRCLEETQKARPEENNKAISWRSDGRRQHLSFPYPQSRKEVGDKIILVKWRANEASFGAAKNAKYRLRLRSTIRDTKT